MKRLLACLALLRVATFALAQDCYWPNGDKAGAGFKPCNNKAGTCCYRLDDAHTDLCYDNGLCYSAFFGNVYRGACTSQTWDRTSGCAQQCLLTVPNGESPISSCSDRSMCCGGAENVTSCCTNKAGFLWNNATLLSTIATTSRSGSSSSSTNGAATQSPNSDGSASGQSSGGSSSSGNSSGSNTALAVGLGTGLGLAVAIILVLTLLLIGQRRRAQHQQGMLLPDSSNGDGATRDLMGLDEPKPDAYAGGVGVGVGAGAAAPWVYRHEASILSADTSERPRSPVMLSDSEIHELDAVRRGYSEAYKPDASVRDTVHSVATSDATTANHA